MKSTILTFFVILALSGCSTLSVLTSSSSVASQHPGISAATEKSLTLVNLALQGLGVTLKSAVQTGLLHGSAAATAQTYYDKADDALKVAHKADDAANEQGVISAISDAQDAIALADALAKQKGN